MVLYIHDTKSYFIFSSDPRVVVTSMNKFCNPWLAWGENDLTETQARGNRDDDGSVAFTLNCIIQFSVGIRSWVTA